MCPGKDGEKNRGIKCMFYNCWIEQKISMFGRHKWSCSSFKWFFWKLCPHGAWCIDQDTLGSIKCQLTYQENLLLSMRDLLCHSYWAGLFLNLSLLMITILEIFCKHCKVYRTRETFLPLVLIMRAWASFLVISRNRSSCWPEGNHWLLLNNALKGWLWSPFCIQFDRVYH